MKAYHEKRTYESGIPVTVFTVENLSFLAHWHIDVEIIYVLEGCIRAGINKESRVLRKGEMAICGSGSIHYYDSRDTESRALLLIFRPDLVDCTRGWPDKRNFTSPFITATEIAAGDACDAIGKIALDIGAIEKELENQSGGYDFFIRSKLFDLCGSTLRYFPSDPIDPGNEYRKFTIIRTMQEVLNFLEQNYMHAITLSDAADKANMSRFHFSRLFSETTGLSFTTYLNSIRLDKAEDLLKNSNMQIVDIAFETGFNSVRTFNRVFRNIKGCTPSRFR